MACTCRPGARPARNKSSRGEAPSYGPGGTYGTCHFYCDVLADCDANGNWTNIRYTW